MFFRADPSQLGTLQNISPGTWALQWPRDATTWRDGALVWDWDLGKCSVPLKKYNVLASRNISTFLQIYLALACNIYIRIYIYIRAFVYWLFFQYHLVVVITIIIEKPEISWNYLQFDFRPYKKSEIWGIQCWLVSGVSMPCDPCTYQRYQQIL